MIGWTETTLTGNQRYRGGLFGRVILQVEVVQTFEGRDCPHTFSPHYANGRTRNSWRDARMTDISDMVRS